MYNCIFIFNAEFTFFMISPTLCASTFDYLMHPDCVHVTAEEIGQLMGGN